jgi:hypothetical protein
MAKTDETHDQLHWLVLKGEEVFDFESGGDFFSISHFLGDIYFVVELFPL